MINEYIKDITPSVTYNTYKGLPLADLSEKERGDNLENVVRQVLEEITGEKTYEPDPGTTFTGKKRGRNSAPFDFYLKSRKCEVKSAQLGWNKFQNFFYANFHNIKRNEYDDLYLALYTPSGVYIYKHDDKYGISTHGKTQESRGGKIQVYAPRNEESIEVATNVVLKKLQSMFIKHVSLDEINITTSVTYNIYKGLPLAYFGGGERGTILEYVVRQVLEEITGEKSHKADPGTTLTGKKRGRNSAPFDFHLKSRKCEVKSAQLGWEKGKKRFCAKFQNIKRNEYDDLYLALYTPSGVYIYKHDDKYGISTNGKTQESCGGYIEVFAPRNEASIEVATNVVLEKLKHMHVKTIKY